MIEIRKLLSPHIVKQKIMIKIRIFMDYKAYSVSCLLGMVTTEWRQTAAFHGGFPAQSATLANLDLNNHYSLLRI